MQLSVATLSAILATLAQAAPTGPLGDLPILSRNLPVPEDAAFAFPPQQPRFQPEPNKEDDSNDVVGLLTHDSVANNNGVNVLGQAANGGIGKRQDNSNDVIGAVTHSGVLDNNGVSVLGQSANGGIGKRQDNSNDVIGAVTHSGVLDNNGVSVLGQSANGGIGKRQDNSNDVVGAATHSDILNNNGLNVAGQSAKGGVDASRLQHKFQPARQPSPAVVPVPAQWAPEPSRANVVGPSFVANQAQGINQQAANVHNP